MIRFSLDDNGSSTTYNPPIKIELPHKPRENRSVFDMFADMGVKIIGGVILPPGMFEAYRDMTEDERNEFIDYLVKESEDDE